MRKPSRRNERERKNGNRQMLLAGKQILVTGATGFVGGTLATRLAAAGAQVRALARSPEEAGFLQDKEVIEIVWGDITDAKRIREVAKGNNLVFHWRGPCAATRRSCRW
jgi:nucleoside-diphosphate-sugar epimerase